MGKSCYCFFYPYPRDFFYFLLGIILCILIFSLAKSYIQKEVTNILSFSLILVGALSNLLDRLQYGVVIDYISIPVFTAFNLADVMILVGVIILIGKVLVKQKTLGK